MHHTAKQRVKLSKGYLGGDLVGEYQQLAILIYYLTINVALMAGHIGAYGGSRLFK